MVPTNINRSYKGFCYLARQRHEHQTFHKIGIGKSPLSRIANLSGSSPFKTEIVHVFPCDRSSDAESKLHDIFRDYRLNGEWFGCDTLDFNHLVFPEEIDECTWGPGMALCSPEYESIEDFICSISHYCGGRFYFYELRKTKAHDVLQMALEWGSDLIKWLDHNNCLAENVDPDEIFWQFLTGGPFWFVDKEGLK